MSITLHEGDLPDNLDLGNCIAVDTETMGLKPVRDDLCLVQLSAGDDRAHLVHLDRKSYDAPNLKKILADKEITKIFHFARFDLAVLHEFMGVECTPLFCTRTASKLVRTYTDRHGLRDICRELLGVELNKQQQSSDWGADTLSEEQMKYAANDVLYLHGLKEKLEVMLEREQRSEIAGECFEFLMTRAKLDLAGWPDIDIFEH